MKKIKKHLGWIFAAFFFLTTVFSLVTRYPQQKDDDIVVQTDDSTAFGIDVSQYNGDIDWKIVKNQEKHAPIQFVIIRSTMGDDRKDKKFQENWDAAKKEGFIVGAYHYYDPNENSNKQAQNYIKTVDVKKGDIIPILDIEIPSKIQSMKKLRAGLKNWLDVAETHYGVTPMIYTGYAFYRNNLMPYKEFNKYPLWIAAYSEHRRDDTIIKKAAIYQFAEHVRVPGIPENWTDGNDVRYLNNIRIK